MAIVNDLVNLASFVGLLRLPGGGNGYGGPDRGLSWGRGGQDHLYCGGGNACNGRGEYAAYQNDQKADLQERRDIEKDLRKPGYLSAGERESAYSDLRDLNRQIVGRLVDSGEATSSQRFELRRLGRTEERIKGLKKSLSDNGLTCTDSADLQRQICQLNDEMKGLRIQLTGEVKGLPGGQSRGQLQAKINAAEAILPQLKTAESCRDTINNNIAESVESRVQPDWGSAAWWGKGCKELFSALATYCNTERYFRTWR